MLLGLLIMSNAIWACYTLINKLKTMKLEEERKEIEENCMHQWVPYEVKPSHAYDGEFNFWTYKAMCKKCNAIKYMPEFELKKMKEEGFIKEGSETKIVKIMP